MKTLYRMKDHRIETCDHTDSRGSAFCVVADGQPDLLVCCGRKGVPHLTQGARIHVVRTSDIRDIRDIRDDFGMVLIVLIENRYYDELTSCIAGHLGFSRIPGYISGIGFYYDEGDKKVFVVDLEDRSPCA